MLHSEVPHLFSSIESPVVLFDEIELDPPLLFGVILPELEIREKGFGLLVMLFHEFMAMAVIVPLKLQIRRAYLPSIEVLCEECVYWRVVLTFLYWSRFGGSLS
jgi:hypothetical protein